VFVAILCVSHGAVAPGAAAVLVTTVAVDAVASVFIVICCFFAVHSWYDDQFINNGTQHRQLMCAVGFEVARGDHPNNARPGGSDVVTCCISGLSMSWLAEASTCKMPSRGSTAVCQEDDSHLQ